MSVATENISHLITSQVLGHHPAVVFPCALLLLVSVNPAPLRLQG